MSDFFNINDNIGYPLEEALNPLGNNENNSLENYEERQKYKDVPYFILLPKPLDSWYDKNYFGRVDPVQNGIVVKKDTSLLKQIRTEGGNLFVLNFVADAFQDLTQHMERAAALGVIDSRSIYTNLEATSGFYNYDRAFQKYVDILYGGVLARLEGSKTKFEKVVDFETYVKSVLDFYSSKMAQSPVTLSGYIVSGHSTPMAGGLSIEVAVADYAKDYNKFLEYIMDPNFRYFVKAARKYGFYVDRNAPWKITADPFSNPMLGYLAEYGVDYHTFFNVYYEKTYSLDFITLQENLVDMYNKFVRKHPVVKEEWLGLGEFDSQTRCRDLVPQKIYRQAITLSAAQDLGDIYWLDLYYKFRTREGNLNFKDYNKRFKKIIEVYRLYGVAKTMRFINNEIKPYLYNSEALRKGLTHINTRGNLVYVVPGA